MSATELFEQIRELRNTIGSNPHPDDFVSEREDLAALEVQYIAVTTEGQRLATEGEGGMFTPHIKDGWVHFTTPEGVRLPFAIWAGWSSVTVGVPLINIDTEGPEAANGPFLRLTLNECTLHEPELPDAASAPCARCGSDAGPLADGLCGPCGQPDVDWCQAEEVARVFDGERCTSCGADWATGALAESAESAD